ncbi:MAG: Arm DNA-binding domain-containing protein, partial [Chromatiales bacterium]
MPLTDVQLRKLKPGGKTYSLADGGGLSIQVLPGGAKSWRLRYRLNGRQESIILGQYPAYSLTEARDWRSDCVALVVRGLSPMALKRGDPIPEDVSPEARELAGVFLRDWCGRTMERIRALVEAERKESTVEAFAWRWFREVAEARNANPRNIRRALEKDILPAMGEKQLGDVTSSDVLAITDRIKARGSDQMALVTRNIIKRMFDYAITR